MLNHFPVWGTVFGCLLLVIALARKSEELKKASLILFAVTAAVAIPVYLTGEPALRMIRFQPGFSKAVTEQHQEVAQLAFFIVMVVGVAALVGLAWFRRDKLVPRWFTVALLVLSLLGSGMIIWTANLGGRVRHTEIRDQFSPSP